MNKTRKNLLVLVLLLAVCAAGLLLVPRLVRTLEKKSFPLRYQQTVEQYAAQYDVDPLMVYSIIRTESGFDEKALSNVGARGLMQITEETFAWIKLKIASSEDLSFDDLWDPQVNIRFGTYYLSRCLQRYGGDLATASAAYHSGWGTVDALLENSAYTAGDGKLSAFPYTQMSLYVKKVQRAFAKYQQLYQ